MADDHCLNCNEHIREINYALGMPPTPIADNAANKGLAREALAGVLRQALVVRGPIRVTKDEAFVLTMGEFFDLADAILASAVWAEREGEIERLREVVRGHESMRWPEEAHRLQQQRNAARATLEAAEAERDRLAEQHRRARQVYLDAVNAGLTVQPTALRDAIEDQP